MPWIAAKIERPLLIDDAEGHATACHRWTELPAMAAIAEEDRPSSRLEPLIAALPREDMKDVRASGGVDTMKAAEPAGRRAE